LPTASTLVVDIQFIARNKKIVEAFVEKISPHCPLAELNGKPEQKITHTDSAIHEIDPLELYNKALADKQNLAHRLGENCINDFIKKFDTLMVCPKWGITITQAEILNNTETEVTK
jgi:hypothetical protein